MPDPSPDTRVGVLSWDWCGQPDLADLARILHDVSGGTVHLREINTGSDEYAVVIAATDLDEATAQAVYERRYESDTDTPDRRS